jgi:hypothetical protein
VEAGRQGHGYSSLHVLRYTIIPHRRKADALGVDGRLAVAYTSAGATSQVLSLLLELASWAERSVKILINWFTKRFAISF